jgi:response regulator RpfG family c-di-GMP phosphodiesterase
MDTQTFETTDLISQLEKILFKRFNILLVDDEDDWREMHAMYFVPTCFNIIQARGYSDAVKIINSSQVPIHFWILDMILGQTGGTGFDILGKYPNYHFKLAISGKADFSLGAKAAKLGAIDCLLKGPAMMSELLYYVGTYLPISFCADGNVQKSMEVLKLVHGSNIFSIADWAEKSHLTERTLERICREQLHLTPQAFLNISLGIFYLLSQNSEFKDLKIQPINPEDLFVEKCLFDLYEYCQNKFKDPIKNNQ